ncbi:TonB-dependent receptor [Fibrella sp. HMF5335]|uniref:TonB-dependent receptor n=1 Tax=Fibrella rubiginis TaxID=2817060 RepID=A0A939GIX5_9BACT|nr:carboxypeptidase regulatory-like domain-containing protein [Fibrella rubiginis]MBO0939919.1 TonB-dependent receptor [Fibrella rubiginis]
MIHRLRLIFACFYLLAIHYQSIAQPKSIGQVVRGRVYDALTDQPLGGASVALNSPATLVVYTDSMGIFRLTDVPVGRYNLTVRYLGYDTQTTAEVLVESGREQVLDIGLQTGTRTLAETVVKGQRPDANLTSAQSITPEQILRYPATYLDPARLATAYAGVVNTNDQANNISIRGNTPNALIWRLEGVEIVNPNHLSNAGTLGDRPTAAGGGVNMLSAQLLGTTRFLTGAFAPTYGNTVGGVMDMSLRSGNDERHERIVQAGLIGLDIAAEGPMGVPGSGRSYLVNYRYSFTGLLGLLGVTFGGEDIRFQDLSMNLTLPTRGRGLVKIFAVMGNSGNVFTALPKDEQVSAKDLYNIRFRSQMGAGGVTYSRPLGQRTTWRTALVMSGNQNSRYQEFAQLPVGFPPNGIATQYDRNSNVRASLTSSLGVRMSGRTTLQAGAYLTRVLSDLTVQRIPSVTGPVLPPDVADGTVAGWLLEPYANLQWQPSPQLLVQAGLHYTYFSYNANSQQVEPRVSARLEVRPGRTFSLAYGLHSQVQQPGVYLAHLPATSASMVDNSGLGLTRAHHLVLGYTHQFNPSAYLKAEAYYQYLFGVPVALVNNNATAAFSTLNLLEATEFVERPLRLVNGGNGRNLGLELTYQQYLTKQLYWLLSGSVYDAQYRTLDGIWRESRFNGRYAANATVGREWTTDFTTNATAANAKARKRVQTWGVNARLTYAGGFLDRSIDVNASQGQTTTYYIGYGYTNRLADYARADLRLYWRKSNPRYNRMLALDIQNVTNAQNQAHSYFDAFQRKIVPQYQLGIIPVLSYRWEF